MSLGTSLVVQWLKLRTSVQGEQVRSLVRELRFRMLRGVAKKKNKTKLLLHMKLHMEVQYVKQIKMELL